MNRRKAREKAMQILFQLDINDNNIDQEIEGVLGTEVKDDFLTSLVAGVVENTMQIDSIIKEHLEGWTIDRIASVEKTVLRIAIYEIKYIEAIPVSVSINEAVELAKKFGDEKSGSFVNGVLSKVIN